MLDAVRVAVEAAAIAAYESFVRNQQFGRTVQYADWCDLDKNDRAFWRMKIKDTLLDG